MKNNLQKNGKDESKLNFETDVFLPPPETRCTPVHWNDAILLYILHMDCTYEKAGSKDSLTTVLTDLKVNLVDDGISQGEKKKYMVLLTFFFCILKSTSECAEDRKWRESSFSFVICVLNISVFTIRKEVSQHSQTGEVLSFMLSQFL